MPRDDLHVFRHHGHYLFHTGDHSADAAATLHVHKRKAVGHEVVAHVNDIGLREKDHAVAVRVTVREMDRPDILAVQMHGGPVVKCNYGQGCFWGRWDCAACYGSAFLQTLADVIVSDDGRIGAELGIATSMVSMEMSVNDKLERFVGDSFEGRFDFGSERRELVIDNHDAVFTHGNADIASRAFQHINVTSHFSDLDFHRAEILLSHG